MSYDNLIGTAQNTDPAVAIQLLIEDNLRMLGTTYLAEITKINGNKVSIKPIIKRKANDKDIIYNNCLVAFPHSQIWDTQHKLKVGDKGIAVVINRDISKYKQTGNPSLAQTDRFKDANDSIFVPLSLHKTLDNDTINYIIESDNGVCKLEFDNSYNGFLQANEITIKTEDGLCSITLKNGIIDFQSQLLSLQSENTTLKTKLSELATILENALIDQTPSGTQPFNSSTVTEFSNWKTSLDELFQS